MRRTILVLFVVAIVATLGSAAPPDRNGKASRTGGCRKSSGQPASTTVSSSAALPDSSQTTTLGLLRTQQRRGASTDEIKSGQVSTSTRKSRGGQGTSKNATANSGSNRRHSRNQRDLYMSATQASSMSYEGTANVNPWGLENLESATLTPSRSNFFSGDENGNYHHRQRRLSGLLDLVQPLLSGDLTTFFTKAVGIFGPLIQMVTSLLGPFLGSMSQ